MFTPRLAVLGAGLMGVGIACHFARHGHAVRLYDTDPQRLAEVTAVASAILRELEASGQQAPADRDAVLARLTPTPTLNALADATLLIEAIPERLALKHALLREALHIVHSGIASPEVVDQVMRASLGRRYAMVGPLEAADMTGLATVQDICQHLLPELASGTEMMSLVAEKVARGDTGARSGQGFYRWDEARHQRIQSRREHQLRFALKP
ncbi:3-hydroxyacyl-CoA dehydrogenase NAD-binding domain-containing protein [Klebsiella pneumoniae]|uniref:3-hydroxyacyl-CoA dehydrogenase family protein n=1 Tax=Klebsiella pneumoniae TaxID=573 RepID=UPI000DE7A804|nr:3-hydroxyacyl-CoA dehydrogenase NAD-binding domain-containing protein [Klebsiella pneumoniae]ELB7835719.1 hypothetical protein [Klebsiella pneumoniae]MDK6675918.1 3-hydroxyacyl-CoA dehydrogenase NAD-binding domain-containing protein [Klebsiella pneumoniae]MDK8101914.1 3-hydroxyacyl-CoA dehydrogenase NAD-binding domain-containing protein [Klebsiella pneumoniae]SSF69299.1 3-hydroxybutyryl-CoA dehydrogenase [Klebsiella pneumoniae]HBS6564273.1 hypothetical protein [Klebsiella pneumoniae]